MTFPREPSGADLPMLGYVVILATVLGAFALGLYWLQKPYAIPNPGLAAYRPATQTAGALALSSDTEMAMERSARVAAGLAPIGREPNGPEQNPERTAQSTIRRPAPVASRPVIDQRRPQGPWGFAQNPFQTFGRWF